MARTVGAKMKFGKRGHNIPRPGYALNEIPNAITTCKVICACFDSFEPSLDFVVVKIPRWDLAPP
jgi:carbamoylphosphate synthase large subunit